jgi:hypothetical protein
MRLLIAAFLVVTTAAPAMAQHAGPAAPDAGVAQQQGIQLWDGGEEPSGDALDVIRRLPPDVRQKLTGDQIEMIIRREQQGESPAKIEAIIIPTVFFLTIIGIVVIIQWARLRREKQLHETLRQMIEKGVDIPPALLVPPRPKDADRRRGVILLAVGCGLMIFFAAVDKGSDGAWGIGAVPALIGAGYLVAWLLGRKDRELE